LLVPHADYPRWEPKSIVKVAMMRDLYSNGTDGREVDALERWLNEEYETPGLAAVEKVVNDDRLSADEWQDLARFFAVQNVRTPGAYSRFMDFCHRNVQPMLDNTMRRLEGMLQRAKAAGAAAALPPHAPSELDRAMRLRVTHGPSDEPGKALVQAVMSADRSLWIGSIRHTLGGIAQVLTTHRWEILTPFGDEEWPLTDEPALCVNWYGPGRFDLKGGWGNPRGDLMLPLSPRHLLHCEIGKRPSISRSTCDLALTRLIQEIAAQGALRWVYGTHPYEWVERARPRHVDQQLFIAEERAIREWDENQRAAAS
jgi:hypothetical protein